MQCNMGATDRILRLFAAGILALLYFTDTVTGTLGIVFIILALIFVVTSAVGFCPLYVPLKISTAKKNSEESK